MQETGRDEMYRILIVDDEKLIRTAVHEFAGFLGYEVTEAENGMEAVRLCRQEDFDIIIMDVMMPVLDGFTAFRKIREFKDIPVLMLSAKGQEYDKLYGFDLGIDDYVTKPFNVKHLFMRCNNLVNGRKLLQKKYAKQMDNNVDILATNGADQQFMEQCVTCIEQNIDNPDFDVNMFAQALNIGRTKLFLKLKGITGQTPNDFILNVRLKKAQMLLIQSDTKTISEIAYEVGFNSPSYFIKRFRELFGITPAQFQKGITE